MPRLPKDFTDGSPRKEIEDPADPAAPIQASGTLAKAHTQPPGPIRGASTAFTDILSVSAARGVSIVLALAALTIVTHLLGPAQYAILAYITVMSGLLFIGTSSWTAAAVTRYGREELEQAGTVRATSWGRLVITAPIFVSGLLLIVLRLSAPFRAPLTWGLVVIACASGLVQISAEHIVNLLEACGHMKLTALVVTLQRGLAIIGLLV